MNIPVLLEHSVSIILIISKYFPFFPHFDLHFFFNLIYSIRNLKPSAQRGRTQLFTLGPLLPILPARSAIGQYGTHQYIVVSIQCCHMVNYKKLVSYRLPIVKY